MQSGDPTLDRALAAFLPIAQECGWSDPDTAAGNCYDAAYGFEECCRRLGIAARAAYWEYTAAGGNELYWGDPDAGEECEVDSENEHMVALVEGHDRVWLVDWTASQYYFDAFPHVQPLVADASGRHLWRVGETDSGFWPDRVMVDSLSGSLAIRTRRSPTWE